MPSVDPRLSLMEWRARPKRKPGGSSIPPGEKVEQSENLFGRVDEAADECAAFIRTAPRRAQALTIESMGHGVSGHRVLQLGKGLVPDFFIPADVVLFT